MELSLPSSLNLYIIFLVFFIYSFLASDCQREIGVNITPSAIPPPPPSQNGIARWPPPPPGKGVKSRSSPPPPPSEQDVRNKSRPFQPPPPPPPESGMTKSPPLSPPPTPAPRFPSSTGQSSTQSFPPPPVRTNKAAAFGPPPRGWRHRSPRLPPPPPPQPPLKDGFNAGKIVGMSFAGIAGILQVGVVGFLVFRRKQLLRFRDRSTQS